MWKWTCIPNSSVDHCVVFSRLDTEIFFACLFSFVLGSWCFFQARLQFKSLFFFMTLYNKKVKCQWPDFLHNLRNYMQKTCMDFKPPFSWSFQSDLWVWELLMCDHRVSSSAVTPLPTCGLTPLKNKEFGCGGIKTVGQMWLCQEAAWAQPNHLNLLIEFSKKKTKLCYFLPNHRSHLTSSSFWFKARSSHLKHILLTECVARDNLDMGC